MENQKYTRSVAITMVIANMIGTGVFTSIGFQLLPYPDGIPDPFAILSIWLLGGLIALCGAVAYAEIATSLKESGGEYLFLSKIYHPALGFTSGWISLFAGFGAPIAVAAIAIGKYSAPILGIDTEVVYTLGTWEFHQYKIVSIIAILIVSAVHMIGVRTGGVTQNILTSIKLILILFFCVMPFFISGYEGSGVSFAPSENSWDYIFSLPFAGALVWVMYAYSGWNASAYIAGNMENPKKNLPLSLLVGTATVMVCYVLLNAVFLYTTPADKMIGQLEIGNVVSEHVMGQNWGLVFSGIFSLALLSTMSAMVIAGPRVTERMGNDYSIFSWLTRKGKGGTPVFAILLQASFSILVVLISSFEAMIAYIGITLLVFSMLTVIGVFILRYRHPEMERPVKAWGYPITPAIFIIATCWMIVFFAKDDPYKLVYSLLTIVSGLLVYFLIQNKK
jgi:APA family basic amino acid/polyamine antiporter